ncbi:MAG TPA: alkaline phosphatase family protein [Kineosporiaceae bacterium]
MIHAVPRRPHPAVGRVRRPRRPPRPSRASAALLAALLLAALSACTAGSPPSGAPSAPATTAGTARGTAGATAGGTAPSAGAASPATGGVPGTTPSRQVPTKVLVIAMENETYGSVIGSGNAPYLDSLAHDFATATAMDAGYPTACPSLAAYLLMTSGDRYGVCDDADPSAHPIAGDNVFQQVAASGREWRNYAESMPGPCERRNSGHFLVRHAPAAYYLSEAGRCGASMVPLGTDTAGALHDDLAAGTLPAYGFVTPDECHDMHGGNGCPDDNLVTSGDRWLRTWMGQIMAGPDYRAGRLIIFISWDEGDRHSNHIPLLAVSPLLHGRTISRPITQCHLLRTTQDVLGLTPLGCAAQADSLAPDLGLSG